MQLNILVVFLINIFVISIISGQSITINEPAKITEMITQHKTINRNMGTVSGWRIQILATTDRRKLMQTKESFLSNYPNISVDWTHANPYYRLRVGAFSTKLEATRMLHILKEEYYSAHLARDGNIKPYELLGILN